MFATVVRQQYHILFILATSHNGPAGFHRQIRSVRDEVEAFLTDMII